METIKAKFNSDKLNMKNIKIMLGLVLILGLLITFTLLRDTDMIITHEEANTIYKDGVIEKLIIDGDYIHIKTHNKGYKIYKNAINKKAFFTKYPIEIKEKNISFYDVLSLLIILIGFGFLYRLISQARLQHSNSMQTLSTNKSSVSSDKVETIKPTVSNVTFDDVAGIKEVKEELEEIIDFLREPNKYISNDIRLPKGVLLVGPPGVGKTLIAKAVAGEAKVPFFYQSGASFVHIYVGMGAKRVSELFRQAKEMSPSIIFIDEVDAVGKSRGDFRNDEREVTLNQLLTEMDGFEDNSGVIVMAATNKIDMLDDALLRAGRFDRRVHISLPDLDDRAKTIELYLSRKANDVDIDKVAQMTIGFNAAALDTLTNEAALYSMKMGRKRVQTADFEAVKDKVLQGKHKILSLTEKEREIQAIYQASKSVVATWLDVEFSKIGLVNRDFITNEHEILSKSRLLSQVKVYLAGSIATKIRYKEQYTNSSEDLNKAKELIHKIIYQYSMGDNLIPNANEEIELLNEAINETTTLLNTLEIAMNDTARHLLSYEHISVDECRDILRKIF